MKSSGGAYYPRLDHVRAMAAFLVFFYHFTHVSIANSYVPPFFAASLFEEGWTGVALFMVLSGYLFAKITDGRDILFAPFLWNRFVRLAPLLVALFAYYAVMHGFSLQKFLKGFVVYTGWPGGAWSLTAEMHFYLAFPLLLLIQRRAGTLALASCLLLSIAVRALWWKHYGQSEIIGYFTILGRIDQFVLGMVFYRVAGSGMIARYSRPLFWGTLLAFMGFWHLFNTWGGLYAMPTFPSPSPWWIILPTIEGLAWGVMIASYEKMPFQMPAWMSAGLSRIGEASYSIYLLHYTIIFDGLIYVLPAPASYGEASLMALAVFPVIAGLGMLSYRFIEMPWFKFRTQYFRGAVRSSDVWQGDVRPNDVRQGAPFVVHRLLHLAFER